ncbi:MAG: ribosome biogenesis GTPase YlqF [Clostridia bacterium]|nr:ribosome biogenesis GTPase YlqF [Clostridia bacterium]
MPTDIIQWFPGHMAATKRLIKENLSSVDVILELADARIPLSSRNPQIKELVSNKPVILILNKASLADPEQNRIWKEYYLKNTESAVCVDCIDGKGIKELEAEVKRVMADKLAKNKEKNVNRAIKAMVLGIPNVGKSTLINTLCGSKKAKAENRPGVTLTKQWVKTSIGLELLDMPGVLAPKFSDRTVGENLSATGAIKDTVVLTDEVALALCGRLRELYPGLLAARYKLTEEDLTLDAPELFETIGRKRGFLVSGGDVDFSRCAAVILDEFRSGKIGRITLERVSG